MDDITPNPDALDVENSIEEVIDTNDMEDNEFPKSNVLIALYIGSLVIDHF